MSPPPLEQEDLSSSSCDLDRDRSGIGTAALPPRALLLPRLPRLDEATEPKLTLLSRLLDCEAECWAHAGQNMSSLFREPESMGVVTGECPFLP